MQDALPEQVDGAVVQKFPLVLVRLKSHNSRAMNHSANDLIMLFNDLFREEYQTELVRGDREPEYLPFSATGSLARIVFAHGYFASALHEISHWCIAGQRRRTLVDYGYWYSPDGRNADQQRAFEQVEVRPQALEWLFSVAAGSRFHISVDNLSGDGACDEAGFHQNVWHQANRYLDNGLPERAGRFFDTLKAFYGTTDTFDVAWRREAERLPDPALAPDEKVNRTL